MSYLYSDGLHTKTTAPNPEVEKYKTGEVQIEFRHVDDETMWVGVRARNTTFSWFTVSDAKDVCRHILAEIERFEKGSAGASGGSVKKKSSSRRR